jgi:hypothetical protein
MQRNFAVSGVHGAELRSGAIMAARNVAALSAELKAWSGMPHVIFDIVN